MISNPNAKIDPFKWLSDKGELTSLIKSRDWSKSSIGLPETWPQPLKFSINLCLNSQHPMFIWWGEDLIQFYNDAYVPSFGKGKHPQAMGQKGKDCWPEIWEIIYPQIESVMTKGKSSWNENHLVPIQRNGKIEDVYWTYGYSPIIDEKGSIRGVLVVCTETTGQVLSSKQLELEHQKLYSVLMQAPVGVCVMEGPEHVFNLVNPVCYELLYGGIKRDILGKTIREALSELQGQGFYELLDGVYKTGEPFTGKSFPAKFLQPDGLVKKIYVDFVYTPKRNTSGMIDGILCVFTDVTERCLAIENLKSEQYLREQFVSLLTHDLRSPLSAAKMSAQLLGRSTITPEKQTSLSGRIVDSINRANTMIENLLDANRIKAGESLPLQIEEGGFVSIVSDCLIDLSTVHGDRFELKYSNRIINGYWSHDAILRIVENLCNNAVKFGKEHSPVTLFLDMVENMVSIKVHNFGKVITPENLEKLFEPYQRPDEKSTSHKPGWGLGLTLVKGLAEAHHGRVEVESSELDGTSFTVYLSRDCRLKK